MPRSADRRLGGDGRRHIAARLPSLKSDRQFKAAEERPVGPPLPTVDASAAPSISPPPPTQRTPMEAAQQPATSNRAARLPQHDDVRRTGLSVEPKTTAATPMSRLTTEPATIKGTSGVPSTADAATPTGRIPDATAASPPSPANSPSQQPAAPNKPLRLPMPVDQPAIAATVRQPFGDNAFAAAPNRLPDGGVTAARPDALRVPTARPTLSASPLTPPQTTTTVPPKPQPLTKPAASFAPFSHVRRK